MSARFLKSLLPQSLFGRALLILVLPVVLVQLFAIYMFYERHWDSIVRNLSNALAGEIMVLVREFEARPAATRVKEVSALAEMMGIGIYFDRSRETVFAEGVGAEDYPVFYERLTRHIGQPFMIQRDDRDLLISVLVDDGVLELRMTKKRLVSSTTYIFLLWMGGSALVLLLIAIAFLRNQIRPIKQLAVAAQRFGMGQDLPHFSPRGAAEVRQAGHAFLTMRQRIRRQVSTRTEMLAGISHDLRTPLTRLRLQLAMLALDPQCLKELEADIEEMEQMIREYLDFARGEDGERSVAVDLAAYLRELVEGYALTREPVTLTDTAQASVELRPKAMRRALQNVIDNAVRYGGCARIRAQIEPPYLLFTIDDDGPGIPEEAQEEVFRPFMRLDTSRNSRTGGVGLGLSIARDVIQAHGGQIKLENRPEGGLRVTMRLPVDR